MAKQRDPLLAGAAIARELIDHDAAIARFEQKLKERKAARDKAIAGLTPELADIVRRLRGETVSEKAKA